MVEPKLRFRQDDGCSYPDIKQVTFGNVIKPYTEKTKVENEDVLLSCAIDGMYLNSELFGHQRGSSNIGYKKVRRNTLILSTQNLHLGNANVNQRFDHGIISPAYNTYDIVGCNPNYMAQWIKRDATKRYFYDATTTGASQCRRNVDWDALYRQVYYLPCEDEQQKIIDFLSSVDEVITAGEEEVANLETQKKAVMKKIFLQEVRFKKEDGNDFPEWISEEMENAITLMSGQDYPPEEYNDTGVGTPYLTGASCILNGRTTAVRWTKVPKCKVNFGDIVIVCKGSGAGTVAIVDQDEAHIARQFMCIRPRKGLDQDYCYHYVCGITEEVRASARGTIPGIDRGTILQRIIELPCLEEQRLIADFLSDFDEAIAAAKKELELWKELKKGLLQQMFV